MTVTAVGADPDPRPRLLCFHHAGGAASAFRGWAERLGSAAVVPVQLPGRESRIREPLPATMGRLTAQLTQRLGPELTGPHMMYGHSMGGLIAYGIAVSRHRAGLPPPRRLLIGACLPPHALPDFTAMAALPDRRLRELLAPRARPSAIEQHPEWVRAELRLLRADLRLCATLRPGPPVRLPCPVEVFVGAEDHLVDPGLAAGWERYTSAGFRQHTVPGGHVFARFCIPDLLGRMPVH